MEQSLASLPVRRRRMRLCACSVYDRLSDTCWIGKINPLQQIVTSPTLKYRTKRKKIRNDLKLCRMYLPTVTNTLIIKTRFTSKKKHFRVCPLGGSHALRLRGDPHPSSHNPLRGAECECHYEGTDLSSSRRGLVFNNYVSLFNEGNGID